MHVCDEVAAALEAGCGVVALETTLLAHGLPSGRNREVAGELEAIVRRHDAVPATVAVLDGRLRVGLDGATLDRICEQAAALPKLSRRDLAPAVALGVSGATTVAGTAAAAHLAGIEVFATGGLGGVHRGARESWDVSADLAVLAHTPVLVVCSGVKSVLDVAATVEYLETLSVPLLGYRTDTLPGFYRRSTGLPVPWRVDSPRDAAAVARAHRDGGVVLAQPVPDEHEMDAALHERLLAEGLALVEERAVRGKDVTPVLLEHFHSGSGGASLAANIALVQANAALAADVAGALAVG